jgi:hypothetical protein
LKCETSSLEIETLFSRIKNNDINLQPDFQRGEVWSPIKKKKLIDSILRGWKIPPIHFVSNKLSSIDEVLDGQQRLVAIRDFMDNVISIDGSFPPIDQGMQMLDGKLYRDLPEKRQRDFRKYIVYVIRLSEYKPEEPAELFYRLNQPTTLTSAEQRNAYMGQTRDQVKTLVGLFVGYGAKKETIGFSNSRLAYDEIISKFCYTIEIRTLRRKVSATEISEKYRNNTPFPDECLRIAQTAIEMLMGAIYEASVESEYLLKLNKATLFSWLVLIKGKTDISMGYLGDIISKFELCRDYLKGKLKSSSKDTFEIWYAEKSAKYPFFEIMINTFNQRASMGSTDALSIIYRDIILHIFSDITLDKPTDLLVLTSERFLEKQSLSFALDCVYNQYDWGDTF